ncbi:MAG: AMP-binding protein [Rhodospirillaceae bacterium]|nr:AMP-binding protein [Rhodospirillaceae bacterium]
MSIIHGAIQDFPLTLNTFLDHAAKWHPRVQVVTGRTDADSTRIGYTELRQRSLRISAVLADKFGVQPGDRVGILAWNTQAHVEAWYAIMGMGAVCHTLNPRLLEAQLASIAARAECSIIIVSADLAPLAQQIVKRAPAVTRIIIIDGSMSQWDSTAGSVSVCELEPLIASARDNAVWGAFDERAPSGLCFTSGTTGEPKGVTYTHRSSFLHALRLLQANVMGIACTDSVLTVVPIYHANAWGLPFAVPAAGAKLVLPGRHTDGAALARLIAAEGVTIAVGVPTVWLGLVDYLESRKIKLPSLKRIIMGGAPLPPALMERIEKKLGVVVQTSWGMTELSPCGTMSPHSDAERSAGASGRPAVGVDLLLTNADGQPLPEQRNVEGHLRVRGASVIERYFGETVRATDAAGWFDTGDLARIDDDGNLFITGRSKDLIKSGGEWINPTEIEAVIGALPEVSLAAVVGRTDPKWGERPILVVEMREKQLLSDDILLASLQGRVAPWWVPDAIVRVPQMPLTSTGKIDKMRLRSQYGVG